LSLCLKGRGAHKTASNEVKALGEGEVFYWRGSAEQRARRSMAGKLGRFAYFDRQLDFPDWRGKAVLDFGGNEGNLLLDRKCAIRPENYYCVDVLKDALEEGRKRFPQAHWVHYNRYNRSFNPEGIEGLPIPELGVKFEFILAFSVFTHTTREEMHSLVEDLRSHLAPGGTLAFTFVDPHYQPLPRSNGESNLRWRLEQANGGKHSSTVDRLLKQSRGAAWCSVVDGSELYVNSNGSWPADAQTCRNYDVFYTAEFLQREFPQAVIRPPLYGHLQHCCLIRR
jgi:SAM-dependent methyltransferase